MCFHGNCVVWKPGIVALATIMAASHGHMVIMVYTHTVIKTMTLCIACNKIKTGLYCQVSYMNEVVALLQLKFNK